MPNIYELTLTAQERSVMFLALEKFADTSRDDLNRETAERLLEKLAEVEAAPMHGALTPDVDCSMNPQSCR